MASIDENNRIAAASAAAANTVPGPIDVIQNYIPPSWLTDVLQDTFKYATVVKHETSVHYASWSDRQNETHHGCFTKKFGCTTAV